jgi:hypothetical protein
MEWSPPSETTRIQLSHAIFNRGERFMESEFQIAGVAVRTLGSQIDAGFGPRIRGIGTEGNANDRGRPGGAS